MKNALILLFLFILIHFYCKAASDTLLIKMKNNQVEKIAVSQIQKIKFENITSVVESNNGACSLVAKGNYPNPFAEMTSIEFEISLSGNVEIIIYDNSGNQIHQLECQNCQAGKNSIQWNCLDKNNNKVNSGVYYYEIQFKNEIQSKKMILVK
ncbi:MAG: Por secretion system C-terminal sorting protein [Ignavibacteria bacterium]|nr:Por secretion system C-terminal sorting protein [Ignavibacteria bacterium]